MLDKEKIEEAKEEIFDKEDFYLYSQEVENPNGKNEYLYTEQQIKDAIGLGIRWAIEHFLKDLWHDKSEKPIMSDHGMIIVELNDITACKYSLWRSTTTYETICNNKGYIRRWLYLNDLLKGGKK